MKAYPKAYDFLSSVIDNVPYGVVTIDMDGYITGINENAKKCLAIPLAAREILETNILDYLSDIHKLKKILIHCFQNGRKEFELKEILFRGNYFNFYGKAIPCGLLLSIYNVTEYKKSKDTATHALLKG